MKKSLKILASIAAVLAFAGCAKETSESSSDAAVRYIEAWMAVHYPDVEPTGIGYYILPEGEKKGTGKSIGDDEFVFLEYNLTDLDGIVSTTTYESVSKRVGTYASGSYYGPAVAQRGEGYMPAGLDFSMDGLNVGDSRKVILPGWTNTTYRYDDDSYYKAKGSSTSSVIYEYTITDSTPDIILWQVDSLERYVKRTMPGTDSLTYGFYLYSLTEITDTVTLQADSTVYVNYIGRRLDGSVFDTTIRDTARAYGIYSSSKTYEPLEVVIDEDYTETTLDGSTTITGFGYALSQMHKNQKARVAFTSDWGYGYSGSSPRIPAYCPLEFEIEVVDEDD